MTASASTIPLRAALYLRVSTVRQAEHDVSIPDQRRQGEAYCRSRGYQLVETFIEAGASATNDRRPEFQRMIEAGASKPAPFDVVVVHSFSRFFRDHFEPTPNAPRPRLTAPGARPSALIWSRPSRARPVSACAVKTASTRRDHLRTLVAASATKPGSFDVCSSVLKWRTRQDSNL